MTVIKRNPDRHMGIVGQSFLAPGDLWSAECSCGWLYTEMLPHDEAVAKAQAHAERENGSSSTPTTREDDQ